MDEKEKLSNGKWPKLECLRSLHQHLVKNRFEWLVVIIYVKFLAIDVLPKSFTCEDDG